VEEEERSMAIAATADVEQRSERLSAASLRTIVEPEAELPFGTLGSGPLIDPELLSVAGLDLDLTDEQVAQLTREELASMLTTGFRFEAALNAGFAYQMVSSPVTDPRVMYMLHEIAEETRHQRAFIRLIRELAPTARSPFDRGVALLLRMRVIRIVLRSPALLNTFVLAGEEIPDLLQKIASEHPGTDPLVVAVNRYHRQEEARHLAFARMTMAENWRRASWLERRRVRIVAPRIIRLLFDAFVHPGVYRAVGLPGFRTWRRVARLPRRVALRYEGTRPVLRALLDAGVLRRGRIPRGWRNLCGVDRHGEPVGPGLAELAPAA
jgi:hypothetical protein